jgi:hypothetical protein
VLSSPFASLLGRDERAVPESQRVLMSNSGLHLPDDGVTVRAIRDNPPGVVSGFEVTFETAVAREIAVSRWPPPIVATWELRDARVWLNPALGLRAVAIHREVRPGTGDCHYDDSSRHHHGDGRILLIEQYLPAASLLRPGTRLWGFEGEHAILGMSRAALLERFGARLVPKAGDHAAGSLLLLPPVESASGPLYVNLAFSNERLAYYRFQPLELSVARPRDPALIDAARDKVLNNWAPEHRFDSSPWHAYGDEAAWLEWEESSPFDFAVRSSRDCPGEHVRDIIRENTAASARWIISREPEPAVQSSFMTLGPVMMVAEQRSTPTGCTARLWSIARVKHECQPARVEGTMISEDCCDDSCLANPAAALRRIWTMAAVGDVDAVRPFIPPAGLHLEVYYGEGTERARIMPARLDRDDLETIAEFYGPDAECVAADGTANGTRLDCHSNMHRVSLVQRRARWEMATLWINAH